MQMIMALADQGKFEQAQKALRHSGLLERLASDENGGRTSVTNDVLVKNILYSVYAKTRKSSRFIMWKASETESRIFPHFEGKVWRKNPKTASTNWLKVG